MQASYYLKETRFQTERLNISTLIKIEITIPNFKFKTDRFNPKNKI